MGSMLNFCFPVIAILPLPRKTRLFYQVDPPAANYLLFRISFRTLWLHYSPETDLLGPISPVLLDYATDALHKHAIRSVNDITDIFPWNPSILKSAPFIRNLWLKLAAREPDSRINTSLMRMLLKNGADTESSVPIADEVDSELTPLSVAARHGNIAAVKLLVKWGADLEHRGNRWGWTALRFAARTTARAENNEVLKFLIEQKADVDAVDRNQETTLVFLVDRSASMNKKAHREPGKKLVDNLRVVRHNILDVFQWTTDSGSTMHDTIKLIAEHSRNLNATDGNGRTALALAAKSRQWTIVELLLNCNADVDIEDEHGMTPLLWALQAPKRPAQHRDKIIGENSRTFIGQVVYRKYQENETVDPAEEAYGQCIEMLIRKSGKIEARDHSGRTALSKAAEIANYDIVKMLLKKGADVNSPDRRGMTPLMWASRRRKVCSAVFRDIHILDNSVAFIGNILILEDPVAEEGPRFELGSYHREERNETIHLLLEHGADLEAADKKGKTALDFALQDELDDVAAFLSTKGAMFSPERVHRRAERGKGEVEGKGKGKEKEKVKGQATNSTVDTNWLELSQVSRQSFVPKRRSEIIITKDNGRAAIPEDDTAFDRNLGKPGSFRTQEKTLETFPRCLFRHLEISGEAEFISRIEPPASWIPTRALRAEYLATFPTCAYKNIWAHGNSDVQCGNLLVICRKRNDMEFAISSKMVGNRFSDIYITDTSTFRCDLFTADRVQGFVAEVLASVWKTLDFND
ncbi:hypothetical protein SLS56_011405 [Neofusicoccum ribis]|uniref:Ankyrin repeat protein n=1 Tax=Neofusicoccum ribis TaxID=45134 RepID=A0ABR3SBQ5_9PEZI